MIVEVAPFLSSIGGSVDKNHYLRPISGRPGYAAYCVKPQYSTLKKKELAEAETVLNFVKNQEEAKRQYHDPVLRAEWEKRHHEALRAASKRNSLIATTGKSRVPARLWDYIRREISALDNTPKVQ